MFSLLGGVKMGMLVGLFVGSIAMNLLYIQVLIKYAYQCQTIINFIIEFYKTQCETYS